MVVPDVISISSRLRISLCVDEGNTRKKWRKSLLFSNTFKENKVPQTKGYQVGGQQGEMQNYIISIELKNELLQCCVSEFTECFVFNSFVHLNFISRMNRFELWSVHDWICYGSLTFFRQQPWLIWTRVRTYLLIYNQKRNKEWKKKVYIAWIVHIIDRRYEKISLTV